MIPIIPLPGKVILPCINTPLNVVRKVGVLATKFALHHDKAVLLLNQKKADVPFKMTTEDGFNISTLFPRYI